MVTVGISKWPTESGHEVGKRSLEMKSPPDFVQVIGPYMYPDENEGITAITIFKYEKSKAGEASEAIANAYMVFFAYLELQFKRLFSLPDFAHNFYSE